LLQWPQTNVASVFQSVSVDLAILPFYRFLLSPVSRLIDDKKKGSFA
jgi:hypothetical protein